MSSQRQNTGGSTENIRSSVQDNAAKAQEQVKQTAERTSQSVSQSVGDAAQKVKEGLASATQGGGHAGAHEQGAGFSDNSGGKFEDRVKDTAGKAQEQGQSAFQKVSDTISGGAQKLGEMMTGQTGGEKGSSGDVPRAAEKI